MHSAHSHTARFSRPCLLLFLVHPLPDCLAWDQHVQGSWGEQGRSCGCCRSSASPLCLTSSQSHGRNPWELKKTVWTCLCVRSLNFSLFSHQKWVIVMHYVGLSSQSTQVAVLRSTPDIFRYFWFFCHKLKLNWIFIPENVSFVFKLISLLLFSNTPPFDSCVDCNVGVFPSELLIAAKFSSKQKSSRFVWKQIELLKATCFSFCWLQYHRILGRDVACCKNYFSIFLNTFESLTL